MARVSGLYFPRLVKFADLVFNPPGQGIMCYSGKGPPLVRGVLRFQCRQYIAGQLSGDVLSFTAGFEAVAIYFNSRKAITETAAAS